MVIIRTFLDNDTKPVQFIMAACTRELRTIYTPKPQAEMASPRSSSSRSYVVAVDYRNTVLGVAECIAQPSCLYVQGLAVSPAHRRRGVAASLLAHIATLATDLGLPVMEITTIKETGNVEIFRRLGFAVVHEQTSERFVGQGGHPVTEVTLERQVA